MGLPLLGAGLIRAARLPASSFWPPWPGQPPLPGKGIQCALGKLSSPRSCASRRGTQSGYQLNIPVALECHRLERVDVEDRLGEGLRGFLGQVVPDAARDRPVLVLACELAGVSAWVRVRRAV